MRDVQVAVWRKIDNVILLICIAMCWNERKILSKYLMNVTRVVKTLLQS
jgi:hypothetical protein